MRVGVVVFSHYSRDGRVRRAAEALVARGDEVHGIALEEAGRPARESLSGVSLERIPLERLSLSRRQTRSRYLIEYGAFLAEATRRLLRLHRASPLDLVHVHNMPDLLVAAALPLKALGVPVVLDIHDLMPDLYAAKFGGHEGSLITRTLIAQLRSSAALADHLITVHDEARDLLVHYGIPRDRIAVVVNASDDAIFVPRAPALRASEGPVNLGYHGSISRRHGIDLLVRAFKRARDLAHAPLHLKIVGEGDATQTIRTLIRDLGLQADVDFVPRFLPVEALPSWLQEIDLGVAPYRVSATTDLMLPCKVFDYANLGIPVIMSELRVPRRLFPENALAWVPGGDVEFLAETIADLADTPERRLGLARRLQKACAPLAWPHQRERLYEVLDLAASGTNRRPLLPSLFDASVAAFKGFLR